MPLFASILRIPFSIIAPVIIVICAIGAYTVHNAMLDIWFMLVFGVVGYVFKKLDYPLAPLVLALVLGDKAEDSFRQAMLMSQGEVAIMWSNPLVGTITTLALVLLFWPLISWLIGKIKPRKPERDSPSSSRSTERHAIGDDHARDRHDPGDGLARQGRRAAAGRGMGLGRHAARGDRQRRRQHEGAEEPDRPPARRQGRPGRAPDHRPAAASPLYTAEECSRWPTRGNVVLRGWGATCLLRPVPHVVCVRITRSLDKRVEWLMGHLETDDAASAEAEMRRSDRAHAARMHELFGVTWGDPVLYDLVLNTDRRHDRQLRRADPGARRAARVRRDRRVARPAGRHGAGGARPRRAARRRGDARHRRRPSTPRPARSSLRGIVVNAEERLQAENVAAASPG